MLRPWTSTDEGTVQVPMFCTGREIQGRRLAHGQRCKVAHRPLPSGSHWKGRVDIQHLPARHSKTPATRMLPTLMMLLPKGLDRWADRAAMGPLPVAWAWTMKPMKAICRQGVRHER